MCEHNNEALVCEHYVIDAARAFQADRIPHDKYWRIVHEHFGKDESVTMPEIVYSIDSPDNEDHKAHHALNCRHAVKDAIKLYNSGGLSTYRLKTVFDQHNAPYEDLLEGVFTDTETLGWVVQENRDLQQWIKISEMYHNGLNIMDREAKREAKKVAEQEKYIPKGFRDKEVDITTEWTSDQPKHLIVKVDDDTYTFTEPVYIKENMTNTELLTFKQAFNNFKENMISEQELRGIMGNPSLYTSLGRRLPSIPAVDTERIQEAVDKRVNAQKFHEIPETIPDDRDPFIKNLKAARLLIAKEAAQERSTNGNTSRLNDLYYCVGLLCSVIGDETDD